jgi:hypothetical protein
MLSRARWFASSSLAMLHAAASSPRAVPRWKQFKWVAPSVAAAAVLASWGHAWNRDRVIDSAFEIGSAPKPSTRAVIARDELIDLLASVVSSPSSNNCYAFISGSLGTGKVCFCFCDVYSMRALCLRPCFLVLDSFHYLCPDDCSFERHPAGSQGCHLC